MANPVGPPLPEKDKSPKLAVIGGRLEDNNEAIYREMHRLSGGRIVVFPTASSEPEAVGQETVAVFQAHGFDAVLSAVHGKGAAAAAQDPASCALVRDYGSVYFTGGNQILITEALAPGGVETPLLAAIRAVHAAGGLVAGSSAGAAMMSETMIVGGTSLEATTFGVVSDPDESGMLLGRGLGFFRWGIVDQHFIKRGRFGRLLTALVESGVERGFGIDENTALFVDGTKAHVVGEYGVFVLDMAEATTSADGNAVDAIGFSYLDDGDTYDLAKGRANAGPDKRRVKHGDIAYRAQARSRRNVFGAYTLYDLLARLVLGDPAYTLDRASAIEPRVGIATTIEFERLRAKSRSFIAVKETGFRMTAIDFRAVLSRRKYNAAQLAASRSTALARDYDLKPGRDARLMLLGSTPLKPQSVLLAEVARHCTGPVGIIASASAEPRTDAAHYIKALKAQGIEAADFHVTIDTIQQIGRKADTIEQIAALKTIILSGGNQIRLAESLLHRGEVTPVLQAIARAHAAGATIVAVSGAAAAMSGFMIAGGTSYEALRFGVASDMGRRGLVIQEGLGFFGAGIVDQNFSTMRRVGRLVVACAEEGVRYGLGICEETGLVSNHDNSAITVVGSKGAVLVDIDQVSIELQDDDFVAPGTVLSFALPGDVIDMRAGVVRRTQPVEAADAALAALVRDFIAECEGEQASAFARDPTPDTDIKLRFSPSGDGKGMLDIECRRDRFG